MSPSTVVLVVLTAAAFPLLLWAIGRTVTAMGEHAPACEPATTATWQNRKPAIPQDQPSPDDS